MAQKKTAAKRKNGNGARKNTARKKSGGKKHRRKNSRTYQRSLAGGISHTLRGVGDTISTAWGKIHDRLWAVNEDSPSNDTRSQGRRTRKTAASGRNGKEGKHHMADEEEVKSADPEASQDTPPTEPSGGNEDISWNQQVSSIIFGVLALLMFALIMFKGDNLWTVIHDFIFGLFGNMAILWNALLVYSGYMFAKQKGAMRILEITRAAAGIIIFIDVLNYILIQSNGYRNIYNELTYSTFQLIGQIYNDGGRLGGTGLIGGVIGEILLRLLGKMGGAIVCCLALFGLSMLISHTTPVALIEGIRRSVKNGWNVATAMFREEIPQYVKSLLSDEDEEFVFTTEKTEYEDDGDFVNAQPEADDTIAPEDMFVITDDPVEPAFPPTDATEQEPAPQNLAEMSVGDLMKKVTSKKKKKKTKSEEIQEQKEEFAKQVDSAENAASEEQTEDDYQYPTVRLLIASKNGNDADSREELNETADKLISTLAEYGVKASISDISRGPTVTRYEINPAPGVKINKITSLSNDIALRLAAQSIRIEAPIPGKPAVGIEIPNKNKQMVRIREILGSKEFAEAKGSLVVALGKDIEGHIVLCDLSKMPHLLIAGSTGSGKSVCVNSMLMSLLYKYPPKEVRMVLIDPKSVEFDMYNGIPHLLVPVVCEPKKAAGALQWAVSEMLKRYGMLKERGARNIDNYNRLAEETGEFEKLCRIVIVIDEMADLMIASPKEVEDAIARLAAMARAAGMYMVLATQRPSVDVITGTIKNNIPSRIALAVSSQVDSRTILDEGGAENLIGYGDMLYHPMGSSKHLRVQGCFVDDIEVERVIRFVKQNGAAEYDDSIADEIERNSMDGAVEGGGADFADKDEFFEKAVEVVTEAGQASTSMLQRRLGVGYARAGRIIDQLEEQGIIGPYEGSKPRAVLITRTQWLEMTMSKLPSGKNDPLVRSHSQFAAQTLDNGHEEITARQSEFFNADEAEDEYVAFEAVEEDDGFDEEYDEATLDEESDEGDDALVAQSDANAVDIDDMADDEEDMEIIPSRVRDLTSFFTDDTEDESVEEAEEASEITVEPDPTAADAESLPQIRDFTSFFTDDTEDESVVEEAEEASEEITVEPDPTAADAESLPQIRDFTSFFTDDTEDESVEEETEEASEITVEPDPTAADTEPLPQVRDFTSFFTDDEENESVEEEAGEASEITVEPDPTAADTEPLPQVRDFTSFFTDDEENESVEEEAGEAATDYPTVKPQTRDFTQFFSNDDSSADAADDLPPWDVSPNDLAESEALRREQQKQHASRDNLLLEEDDDDELYNEILSSSWVKRLDD